MINGFIACPSALNQKEIFCYLICCVILSGVVSGGLFLLLRYIDSLEKNLENLEEENNKLKFSLKIMGKGNKAAKEESKKQEWDNENIAENLGAKSEENRDICFKELKSIICWCEKFISTLKTLRIKWHFFLQK